MFDVFGGISYSLLGILAIGVVTLIMLSLSLAVWTFSLSKMRSKAWRWRAILGVMMSVALIVIWSVSIVNWVVSASRSGLEKRENYTSISIASVRRECGDKQADTLTGVLQDIAMSRSEYRDRPLYHRSSVVDRLTDRFCPAARAKR